MKLHSMQNGMLGWFTSCPSETILALVLTSSINTFKANMFSIGVVVQLMNLEPCATGAGFPS